MKIHLDTDIGGDIDDLCALAMVLAWPGADLVGVTTVAEENGRRAGYAAYALRLAGRDGVPVAAGADVALGRFRFRPGYPPEERYWPEPVRPHPGPLDHALDLLQRNIGAGATIVGVGPFTNLALLEERRPGVLAGASVVLMGSHVRPAPSGFPRWGTREDYNVQPDVAAARRVLESADPTLVPIEVTAQTALRRAYLPALRRTGPLGALIARQADACARDWRNEVRYGQTCSGLPDDTINFQHDPLACAVALGWPGVTVESLPLILEEDGGWLHTRVRDGGKQTRVVTDVDAPTFGDLWLRCLTGSTEDVCAGYSPSAEAARQGPPQAFPRHPETPS
jgi:inosine-uridine nucleoside N-ribohydrolase